MSERAAQEDRASVTLEPAHPLIATYFEQQAGLRRFIAARYGPDQADDLMQDLYLKIAQLDPVVTVINPRPYLYRLALNLSLDTRRSRTRAAARDASWRVVHNQTLDGHDITDEAAIEDVLTARRRLRALVQAVGDLPERTRKAFLLHKIDGLSQAQTAATMGVSQRAVEKRLRAALTTLLAKVDAP